MKFITSPIFYVNGKPHLGHMYTSVAVDILGRWEMLMGRKVFVSTGTDEHGQKVQTAAQNQGKSPQEFVDSAFLPFKDLMARCNVRYDAFIRTTDQVHKETAVYVWNRLVESGLTYDSFYEGWYSKSDEAYYKDDQVMDGFANETGSAVEYMREDCIFFKLSAMKHKLVEFYEQNPDAVQPHGKYAEVMGLLRADLPDLAISRSRFDWGIPVPNRPGHVMYVWIDALSNYLTVLGYPNNDNWRALWSDVVHVIGKDILKFHAIYWPAFLMAIDVPPPNRIFAHGWWNDAEGRKMSKSLNNVIDPFELLEKYDLDILRYYMLASVNFGNDGNFSEEGLVKKANEDLANGIGNLVQRVLTLCYREYGATVGYVIDGDVPEILGVWDTAKTLSEQAMQKQNISEYLRVCREAVMATNAYIQDKAPWSLEGDAKRDVLSILCLCIQRMALLYYPVMPQKCISIADIMGLTTLEITEDAWNRHEEHALSKPEGLFSRM